jgi:hypothetical protein
MQLAERDFIVGGHKIGTIPFYTDIDPILEAHKPGTRVLPAAFFYERGGHFELIKRHEPGASIKRSVQEQNVIVMKKSVPKLAHSVDCIWNVLKAIVRNIEHCKIGTNGKT